MPDLKFKDSEDLMRWLVEGNTITFMTQPNLLFKLVDGELLHWYKGSGDKPENSHSTFFTLFEDLYKWSKYIEPLPWFERITNPVLCWTSNINSKPSFETTGKLDIISGYSVAGFDRDIHTFVGRDHCWNYAVPLTDEEKALYSPNID